MIALVITLADQIASGLCKPFFARFRPTQDPNIMYMVDIVNGYRGGRFGFISSHAANTFAISVFLSLLIKRKSLTFMLLFWAVLNSYSRIYLGVHYPGDILFGAIEGCFIGYLIYPYIKLFAVFPASFHTHRNYKISKSVIMQHQIMDCNDF